MAENYPSCRGGTCDNGMRCIEAGACQYKSSADEAREVMEKSGVSVHPATPGCDRVGGCLKRLNPTYGCKCDSMKPSNPKDLIGSSKVPLHLWPETASALGAMGLLDGALKYGRSNFREIGVRASIYVDAARRHLGYWFEGEDTDPDSGLPHLAHVLACLAILVDADAAGKLTDDRMVRGGFRRLMTDLTPHVGRLKELHREKHPKHYTIADNTTEGPR